MEPLHEAMQSTPNGPLKAKAPPENITRSKAREFLTRNGILYLFKTYARRFGHKWDATNSDKKSRDVWFSDLASAGLTDSDIAFVLKSTVSSEWPLSVGEFIKAADVSEPIVLKGAHKPFNFKLLPKPIDKVKAKREMENIKKIFVTAG